ncbi:nudix hydrolase 16, mitochondrial isoform X1 [Brassica rapa]|uniref:nudix hydrolase 16, mitochondrial isoform X1 n=1 Tax=Brassica campestris TaxID=3711 RepID=UPI0004F1B71D|nr:nudix hydrolase 16, mitochondrial isoform X1 [Brassica rapa]
MCDLVARTGRLQQRYADGSRLVAGCIPFRYLNSESGKVVHVLMISSSSGPGLLFPKGGWENDETVREAAVREAVEEAGVRGILMVTFLKDFLGDYEFKSKTHQDECSPEGLCKAAMYALYVKEELETWPEQKTRTRTWLTIEEAVENCRHAWMKDALVEGFCKWLKEKMSKGEEIAGYD